MAAPIHGGPHDGGVFLSPVPGQVGLVLSLSPEWPDPRPGEAGAYYQWTGRRWLFFGFVGRDANWEKLFWDRPRRVKPNWLAALADAFWRTEE
jgi:hypothetical protein